MNHIVLLACLFLSYVACGQQTATATVEKPKTKLETFIAQDGVVIIQGISVVGTAKGEYGSSVTIRSKELINAATKAKQYGITIEVKETSRITRDNTSYIDYDEIESVIKGLDYISKIDKTITKLDGFQADYRTRGDFKLSTFSTSEGTNMLAVESGRIGSTSAYFNFNQISKVRDLISEAKQKLDAVKQ